MSDEEKRATLVVIATSGSTDYLSDTTVSRRFWPVTVPEDGEVCDSLHAEGARRSTCARGASQISAGEISPWTPTTKTIAATNSPRGSERSCRS